MKSGTVLALSLFLSLLASAQTSPTTGAGTASKESAAKQSTPAADSAADVHYITGVLLKKDGAPVAGALVCASVTSEGKEYLPMGLAGGRLSYPTAKSDPQGRFRITLEGSWDKFRLGLCRKNGLAVEPIKRLAPNEIQLNPKGKTTDVGKVIVP